LRKIATRFGTSVTALFRHRDGHLLIEAVKREREAKEVARVDDVVGHVQSLRARTEHLYDESQIIYREARDARDQRTALKAIRESAAATRETRGNLQLLARLTGQLDAPVNVQVDGLMVVLPRVRRETDNTSPCSPGKEIEVKE
jgi:hypothetical protein